jgi:phage terminase large subunit-like protein
MGMRGPGAKKKRKPANGSVGKSRKKPVWQRKGLTRAGRVIAFIESLKVTSGTLAGKPMKVRPWQKVILEAWYREKNVRRIVRTGLLSVARKNGKTGLIAALALCHLLGPEQERRGQIVVGATDRDQSGLIFDELCAFISDNPQFEDECNIKRHEKQIEHLPSGSKFRALSSDAKKAHGLSPSVVILDELAQWGSGTGRQLFDALTTASGARKDPLTIIIGTQSADDHNLMSELVDYAKQGNDPTFAGFVFEIPKDLDVFDESTWILANPALNDFRSLEDMRSLAERAKRMPTLEATFRNLFCNQRVDAEERWIPPGEWFACQREEPIEDVDLLAAGRCYGGLDLGSVRDLTAFALFWPDAGYLKVWSWCPADNLRERAEKDRVPYDVWSKKGYILPTPGKATDKRKVALKLGELCAKYDPVKVAFDQWAWRSWRGFSARRVSPCRSRSSARATRV